MKAIETRYKGCRFRSRLEARWAVFFDALGIRWEYEKEGFDLGGVRYLPDFWIPAWNVWFEVKGEQPDKDACEKAERLRDMGGAVVIASGPVGEHTLVGYVVDIGDSSAGTSERECQIGYCSSCGQWTLHFNTCRSILCGDWETPVGCQCVVPDRRWGESRLQAAFSSARSARFEFGETPRV